MAKEVKENEQPSIEALMNALRNAKAENDFLKNKLDEAVDRLKFLSVGEVYKRIDVLWNILTSEDMKQTLGKDFYNRCVEDFKEIMFPPISERVEEDK